MTLTQTPPAPPAAPVAPAPSAAQVFATPALAAALASQVACGNIPADSIGWRVGLLSRLPGVAEAAAQAAFTALVEQARRIPHTRDVTRIPDRPGPTLHPDGMGGFPCCERCFQRPSRNREVDLSTTTDRRITPDGTPTLTCTPCFQALAAGRPVTLPTGDALTRTWENLARWTVNEEIPPALTGDAVATLAAHLPPTRQTEAFEELCAALLFRQAVHCGDITPAEVEQDLAHPQVLDEAADTRVRDALAALTGTPEGRR